MSSEGYIEGAEVYSVGRGELLGVYEQESHLLAAPCCSWQQGRSAEHLAWEGSGGKGERHKENVKGSETRFGS